MPKMCRTQQRIEGVKNSMIFVGRSKLLVVLLNKACGFCLMKEKTYCKKLQENLDASQFETRKGKK